MPGLFSEVRGACKSVAERSRFVRIASDRLPAYADGLPLDRLASPEIDPERHFLGHGDDTVSFFLTLNTLNFGSGYFPHLRKRPGMSGYFTIASSLTDRFRQRGPWSAEALEAITPESCAEVFAQDLAVDPVRELMGLFAEALNDLGSFLVGFGGSPAEVVRAAGGSTETLVRSLLQMPFFRDVERYGDLEVPFYKRAQITCSDLAVAFEHTGPGRFEDLGDLTLFADNLVPHVLRIDGVLEFEDDLVARIDREELLEIGSPEEIEIRACALHAVEQVISHLREKGKATTASQVDHHLWGRGQGREYKSHPRHRCRCVYY
jgi:hypothetical protein